MRLPVSICLFLLACPFTAVADSGCDQSQPCEQCQPCEPCCPTCPQRCLPTCRRSCCRPVCKPCKPCKPKPQHVVVRVPEPEPMPQAGAFAAPPQTGTVAGATNSLGIRGLAIRFPAWDLRLPTLQLPSFVRYRTNAHMEIDSSTAPFVAAPTQAYG